MNDTGQVSEHLTHLSGRHVAGDCPGPSSRRNEEGRRTHPERGVSRHVGGNEAHSEEHLSLAPRLINIDLLSTAAKSGAGPAADDATDDATHDAAEQQPPRGTADGMAGEEEGDDAADDVAELSKPRFPIYGGRHFYSHYASISGAILKVRCSITMSIVELIWEIQV